MHGIGKRNKIKETGKVWRYESTMTGKSLAEYVSTILELETQKRTLQITECLLEDKKYQLATTSTIRPPKKQHAQVDRDSENVSGAIGNLGYGVLALLAIVILFQGMNDKAIVPLVVGLLIAGVSVMGMLNSSARKEREYEKRLKKAEREADLKYKQDFEEYQKELSLERQAAEWQIAEIDPDLTTIHQIRVKTEALLEQYYGLNIVHESYRNIVPIASFYHYLSTGICSELEGPNGCYRLYEAEVLQKVIITKLDRIIEQLDELNERQSELKKALLDSNAAIEKLTGYVRGVENENRQHHAIMQYNQECIGEEIRLQNEYIRMRDWLNL